MKFLGWKQIVLALAGFAVIILALLVAKAVPAEALSQVVQKALTRPAGWRNILKESTPLLLLGCSVFLALKVGLFNIGADGQFVMGACAAVVVALNVPGPLAIPLAILAGILGGALLALPVGLIKAYRGGHEVITTIMLNNIAGFFTFYLVSGPLKDPTSQQPSTASIPATAQLPNIYQQKALAINSSLLFAIICVIALWWYLKKTVGGYEISATGENANVARFAGINVNQLIVRTMSASGAIAGLAGALQVLAFEHRFYGHFSPGYGFDALGVALLAGGNPLAILASGTLFGTIAESTSVLSRTGVPKGISYILLGVLVIVFAAYRYRKEAQRGTDS
ncbi:MAG: ABC transporter permease [Fimbriimonadaceae bacterium]